MPRQKARVRAGIGDAMVVVVKPKRSQAILGLWRTCSAGAYPENAVGKYRPGQNTRQNKHHDERPTLACSRRRSPVLGQRRSLLTISWGEVSRRQAALCLFPNDILIIMQCSMLGKCARRFGNVVRVRGGRHRATHVFHTINCEDVGA